MFRLNASARLKIIKELVIGTVMHNGKCNYKHEGQNIGIDWRMQDYFPIVNVFAELDLKNSAKSPLPLIPCGKKTVLRLEEAIFAILLKHEPKWHGVGVTIYIV
jgi:hypothetical protein